LLVFRTVSFRSSKFDFVLLDIRMKPHVHEVPGTSEHAIRLQIRKELLGHEHQHDRSHDR